MVKNCKKLLFIIAAGFVHVSAFCQSGLSLSLVDSVVIVNTKKVNNIINLSCRLFNGNSAKYTLNNLAGEADSGLFDEEYVCQGEGYGKLFFYVRTKDGDLVYSKYGFHEKTCKKQRSVAKKERHVEIDKKQTVDFSVSLCLKHHYLEPGEYALYLVYGSNDKPVRPENRQDDVSRLQGCLKSNQVKLIVE